MPSYQNNPKNPGWIGTLDTAGNIPAEQVGSKIHHISRLRKMGSNVPDGFFLTTQAYEKHLSRKDLFSVIQDGLRNPALLEKPDTWLQKVRNAIIHTELDEAFIQSIRDFYKPFTAQSLAVRSSATFEDSPETSFAGQHDTFLGICDFQSCIEAVLKCWASVWTPRAFFYRQKTSIDHLKVEMAVLVQTMVRADYAGVIFTVNPVNGRPDQLILESCRGLGKALVDGEASPDRFILSKRKLNVLSKEIRNTDFCYVLDSQGRLDKQSRSPIPIHENEIRKLAHLAIRIEKAFGNPQDIEWAIEKGKIYILQTRPITTHIKEKKWLDRQIWCNMNSGEVLPDVVTPITWSLVGRMFKPLFVSVWKLTGSDLGENPVVGLVAGRAYFNLNTAAAAVQHFPEFIRKDRSIAHALGGNFEEAVDSGQLVFHKEDLPDLRGSMWKFMIRLPETLWKVCIRYRLSRGKYFLEDFGKKTDAVSKLDCSTLSTCQLAQTLLDSVDSFGKGWDLLIVTGAMAAYPLLKLFLKRWLHDDSGLLLNEVIRGQEGMEDAQAGFDLCAMASCIKEYPALQKPLLSSRCWAEFHQQIKNINEGEIFLSKWNDFLGRHGHHCRGELELFNPRWSETPDYVFQTIRNYYSGIDTHNPLLRYAKDKKCRDELLKQIRTQLGNPFKRRLVFHFIERCKEGARLRENWKSQAVRYIAWLRKWLLVLGRKLYDEKILENAQDIFFLKFEELPSAAESQNTSEWQSLIRTRADEYRRNITFNPPPIVVGRFNPEFSVPQDISKDIRIFKGLSVYPGKVTGPARVILKTDDKEQVLPGEILVAPFTDPGWTPYFLTAAGIVMDQGGLLSHGSIVAREYGIPAVVNVGPATKVIKTGQKILLDADSGTVTVIKD